MQDFTKMENAKKIELLQSKNEEALNTLINGEEWYIRNAVATYGNDSHRDVLVNDEHWYVRETVAQFGNDSHRTILVNDEDWYVRQTVAQFGNDEHRAILVNDEIEQVSECAKKYMGSTVHILTKRFGTYKQANLLQVFEGGYKIISGCYKTDSLTEWVNKAKSQGLPKEVIEKEVAKIEALIV